MAVYTKLILLGPVGVAGFGLLYGQAPFINWVQAEALREFQERFLNLPTTGQNNEWDAFKHTYAAATTAILLNKIPGITDDQASQLAEMLGQAREPNAGDPSGKMDLYNNREGANIGVGIPDYDPEAIADAVEGLMTDGNGNVDPDGGLILDPSDQRIDDMVLDNKPLGDFLDDLTSDYNWALGKLDDALGGILPEWVTDAAAKFEASKTLKSPLIFDLDSDGIELTAFNSATTQSFFDLDNDGYAEQTAWITGDDAFLARDINGNGKIDNASELFGSATIDGFSILQLLDSNGDFVIDANDDAWSELLLWQDIDGDAISEPGELLSLDAANIASIDLLGATAVNQVVYTNLISQTSTFKWVDGTTGTIVDAWFKNDDVNTYDVTDYALDARTLFLPTLRGFGELSDLYIAMSRDAVLLTKVQDFTTNFDFSDFSDVAIFNAGVEDILFRWAGVDGVNPTSRGEFFDAQRLGFLEKMMGENYLQEGIYSNPNEGGVIRGLTDAWDIAFESMKIHLLFQAGADQLFEADTTYDQFTGQVEGSFTLSQLDIDGLVPFATATGVNTQSYWLEIAAFLDATKGIGNLTTGDDTILDTAIINSDPTLSWNTIRDIYTAPPPAAQIINGGSGDDVLIGGEGNDTITDVYGNNTYYGRGGDDTLNGGWFNDVLYGESGDDVLIGGDGDDILYGGTGNDYLEGTTGNNTFNPGLGSNQVRGGTGNDTYIYSGGEDVYFDAIWGGTDKIVMPVGVTLADLSFSRIGAFDLLITVAGYGLIQINNQINNNYTIETIEFSDSSTFDLLALPGLITHGTDAGESLAGVVQNTVPMNNTIYGYGGDDNITAGSGDDIIDGGAGNDYINSGGGNDTIIASPGFDTIAPISGYGVLVIPEEYGPEDVSLIRKGNAGFTDYNHLYITIAGLGQMKLSNQFIVADAFDMISFASGAPSIDLSTVNYTAYGTETDDYITGVTTTGGQDDTIYGYGGNDNLLGNGGSDLLYGGDGNDLLYGNAGNDYLDGGDGNDTLYGNGDDDTYMFSNGLDTIYENNGADKIVFASNITLEDLDFQIENNFDVRITYTPGVDETLVYYQVSGISSYVIETLEFSDGFNLNFANYSTWQWGTSGNDLVSGDASDNTLLGKAGDDQLNGGGGQDTIHGGAGNDEVYGGSGNDQIAGGEGDDTLYGDGGSDLLYGGLGNDILWGGLGNDTYYFTGGNDTIIEEGGTDILYLPTGVGVGDVSFLRYTTTPQDMLNLVVHVDDGDGDPLTSLGTITVFNQFLPPVSPGDTQTETLRFQPIGEAVLTDIRVTTLGGALDDTILGVDYGANPDDTILGLDDADTIAAGAGNDTIFGGTGDDTLLGEAGGDGLLGEEGNDWLYGGDGDDFLFGDEDADVATEVSFGGIDHLYGDGGNDWLEGNKGDDYLYGGTENDTLFGDEGSDILNGDAGNDYLMGGIGNDTLDGGLGIDTASYAWALAPVIVDLSAGTATGDGTDTLTGIENVIGSAGNDTITGDSGANVIEGGAGVDTLYGGGGVDTFLYNTDALGSIDNIQDFSLTDDDVLDISNILTGYVAGSVITDFVQITDNGTDSILSVDTDGGADNFVAIANIIGVTGLTNELTLETDGNLIAA